MNGPMNGNYWQTGGVDLPLGQQYLPLNRKPRIWLPVVDYPTPAQRPMDAWPTLA